MKSKICRDCHKRKPLTEYYRREDFADGHYRRCKACCAEVRRRRYLESRQQVLDQQREYYTAREKIRAAQRTYYETHREYAREYYRRNREKMLEYGRKYREAKRANGDRTQGVRVA